MAKPLVIVESKAKAKTIEGFLGRDRFVVMASVGHIRDLPHGAKQVPKSVTDPQVRRLGIDVDDHFAPIYVVPDAKKHVVQELKAALKDASELYLATDEDREGEAISWHLLEVLKPNVPVKRMVFHEITADAIADAIDNWRDLDMKLVEAQEGRRVLDRLVGYEVSNVAFRRIGPGTSAGRVQSVATRLVVDRERARMAFRAASYWDLEGDFAVANGANGDGATTGGFTASLVQVDGKRPASGRDFDAATGRLRAGTEDRLRAGTDGGHAAGAEVVLLDEAAARALVARLDGRPFRVVSVESRLTTERPRAPFITSTLQQEASRKLGFSAARTMHVAQGLYERGLITYMRTDSTTLADQAVRAARGQIARMYGDQYLPPEPRSYRSKVKNAQEAHEAIRPAGDRMRTADDLAASCTAPTSAVSTTSSGSAPSLARWLTPAFVASPFGWPRRRRPARKPSSRRPGAPSSSRAISARTSKGPTTPTPSSRTARPSCRRSPRATRSTVTSFGRWVTPPSRRRGTPRRAS